MVFTDSQMQILLSRILQLRQSPTRPPSDPVTTSNEDPIRTTVFPPTATPTNTTLELKKNDRDRPPKYQDSFSSLPPSFLKDMDELNDQIDAHNERIEISVFETPNKITRYCILLLLLLCKLFNLILKFYSVSFLALLCCQKFARKTESLVLNLPSHIIFNDFS